MIDRLSGKEFSYSNQIFEFGRKKRKTYGFQKFDTTL